MAAVGNGGGGKPSSRWLDAVRYTVAAVVTVLIVAVIVNAIKVVLRPDSLTLSIVGGSMFSRRSGDKVAFLFNLQAANPSGRALMYYDNVTAYVFDKNMSASTLDPGRDCFVYFDTGELTVPPRTVMEYYEIVYGKSTEMTPGYFDLLYNNKDATISDVTMRLDGNLITGVSSVHNTTTRRATYYCGPLVVGGDPDDETANGKQKAPCNMVQGSKSLG